MGELPVEVERAVGRYLRLVDRLRPAPGGVVGLYVIGSVVLGAYRHGRSDVDLVAVVGGRGTQGDLDLRRLRAVQVASGVRTAPVALRRLDPSFPGTVNVTYVREADLTKPVSAIVPLATHVGHELKAGEGDVNPVQWKVLAERGIAVRGPASATLGLDPEPATLADWNRRNLEQYWRPWAEGLLARAASPPLLARLRPRWVTAWGVLGPPRLVHTIETGEVIGKEAAGELALRRFDERWHPLIEEALAYWREQPARPVLGDRYEQTARFVLEVVRSVA
jgi:hypothetical protein